MITKLLRIAYACFVAALICSPRAFAHDGDHPNPAPPDAKCVTQQILVGAGAET